MPFDRVEVAFQSVQERAIGKAKDPPTLAPVAHLLAGGTEVVVGGVGGVLHGHDNEVGEVHLLPGRAGPCPSS